MNERGGVSVNALLKALPFDMSDNLLLLSIFGSQVKGTERPDSDLDALFVARKPDGLCYRTIHNTITKAPGGVKKVTLIPHNLETVSRTANVYGTVEYGILREDGARTLYKSADFDVQLHLEIDYEYSAGRWLDMAEKYIFPKEDYSERWPGSTCFDMYLAIVNLLRAGLMACRARFPFTRDVQVLYDMLPPEKRPSLDVDAAVSIRKKYDKNKNEKNWSQEDVAKALEMAKQVYHFTHGVVKHTFPTMSHIKVA